MPNMNTLGHNMKEEFPLQAARLILVFVTLTLDSNVILANRKAYCHPRPYAIIVPILNTIGQTMKEGLDGISDFFQKVLI